MSSFAFKSLARNRSAKTQASFSLLKLSIIQTKKVIIWDKNAKDGTLRKPVRHMNVNRIVDPKVCNQAMLNTLNKQ